MPEQEYLAPPAYCPMSPEATANPTSPKHIYPPLPKNRSEKKIAGFSPKTFYRKVVPSLAIVALVISLVLLCLYIRTETQIYYLGTVQRSFIENSRLENEIGKRLNYEISHKFSDVFRSQGKELDLLEKEINKTLGILDSQNKEEKDFRELLSKKLKVIEEKHKETSSDVDKLEKESNEKLQKSIEERDKFIEELKEIMSQHQLNQELELDLLEEKMKESLESRGYETSMFNSASKPQNKEGLTIWLVLLSILQFLY